MSSDEQPYAADIISPRGNIQVANLESSPKNLSNQNTNQNDVYTNQHVSPKDIP